MFFFLVTADPHCQDQGYIESKKTTTRHRLKRGAHLQLQYSEALSTLGQYDLDKREIRLNLDALIVRIIYPEKW